MRWYYILIAIPLVFLFADYSSDGVATGVTAWQRDSVNDWWSDSSAVYSHLSEIRDTSTVTWNDSIAVVRNRLVADTIDIDSTNTNDLVVNNYLYGSSTIRGTATFGATLQTDTVAGVTGVSANSYIFIQVKGSTVPTAPFTWSYLATDSFCVHCAEADTAVARGSGYDWLRLE